MREAFSHPAMEGIIIFGGWKPTECSDECLSIVDSINVPKGCSQMCLVDNNFKNQPIGDVVDKLILNECPHRQGWTFLPQSVSWHV